MKFYGQFDPPVDKILYDRYFKDIYNGTSIEAGAFDGVTESSTYFFGKNLDWKNINIEPLENVYKKLVEFRPEAINFNLALSNENTTKIIRNYHHPELGFCWGNASIKHTDEHREFLEFLSSNNFIEQQIKTITYKKLIEDLQITKLDLFVLDVEGHEIEVLEGMTDCDVLPDVFVIEHGHRSVDFFQPFLDKLNSKYKLDYTHMVNSFYIKET